MNGHGLVKIHWQHKQIVLHFDDLKSHRQGKRFKVRLTRKSERIEVLFLFSAMATFASWLVGMRHEASGLDARLAPFQSNTRLHSIIQPERETRVLGWRCPRFSDLIIGLINCLPQLFEQRGVPAEIGGEARAGDAVGAKERSLLVPTDR